MLVVGLWAAVLGYALLYTGVGYFVDGANAPSLAQVFGVSTLQGTPFTTTTNTTANPTTSSQVQAN